MRSEAHDMSQLAGCGAHLESLRRTAVGEFELADAHTLEELDAASKTGYAHRSNAAVTRSDNRYYVKYTERGATSSMIRVPYTFLRD
jgi:tRNA U55 pseudouridine synthase TruB